MLESSRLLRPLLFLYIQYEGIGKYRWVYPLIWISLLFFYILLFPITLSDKIAVLNNLILSTFTILTILPGFYIAALAAIATFKASTMDVPLDGKDMLLHTRESDRCIIKLTRRRFLCLLFGYLSFLSLILCLFCLILKIASPIIIIKFFFSQIAPYLNIIFVLVYGFFFMQLISLTLLGLFYLSDRIHWKTTKFRT